MVIDSDPTLDSLQLERLVDEIATLRPLDAWYYAPISSNQRHNLTINYAYDLPHYAWNHALARAVLEACSRTAMAGASGSP